jgi:4-azaleucine resistance transporter AzlC
MADGFEKASPRDDWLAGVRAILPIAVAAVPIAVLFGALAVSKGLSVTEATLMSIVVFAGGAQFAAVQLLAWPVPVFALVLSTLLINLRHVLMAVSLTPKLRGFSPGRQLAGFFFLTDEGWAIAEARALHHRVTPAFWFAVSFVLFTAWVSSSLVGALAGTLLGDPARFGADFAFTALFIGLIAGFWKARHRGFLFTANFLAHGRTFLTIGASAVVAALVYVSVGPPWHVLAGAFAGMLAAFLSAPSSEGVR